MPTIHKIEYYPPKPSNDWVQCAPSKIINRTSHNRSIFMEYHKVISSHPFDEMVEVREFETSRMTGCKDLRETMKDYYEEISPCN